MSVGTAITGLLPPLPPDEFAALKADILAHGVLVPIEKDEEGNPLDGAHRMRAVEELRHEGHTIPDPPVAIRTGLSAQEKIEHALTLNLVRRQLDREERKELVRQLRRQGMSLRRIAYLVGVSKDTASRAVRSQGVSIATPAKPIIVPDGGLVRGKDGKDYRLRQAASGPTIEPIEEKKEAARYTVLLDDLVKNLSAISGKLRKLAETQSTLDVKKLTEERPWVATKLRKIAAASGELSAFVSPNNETTASIVIDDDDDDEHDDGGPDDRDEAEVQNNFAKNPKRWPRQVREFYATPYSALSLRFDDFCIHLPPRVRTPDVLTVLKEIADRVRHGAGEALKLATFLDDVIAEAPGTGGSDGVE